MRDLDAIFLEKRISELEKNGGNSDYEKMNNKPSINNVVLEGNKSLADLGITESVVNYSTDEKVVGTWLDGKKIYEKTIVDFSPVENTGAMTKDYDLNIPNVDNVISIQMLLYTFVNQPLPSNPSASIRYSPLVENNNLKLRVETGSDRHTIQSTFTVRYTKIN